MFLRSLRGTGRILSNLKQKVTVRKIFFIISVIIFIYSSYKIVVTIADYQVSKTEYRRIQEIFGKEQTQDTKRETENLVKNEESVSAAERLKLPDNRTTGSSLQINASNVTASALQVTQNNPVVEQNNEDVKKAEQEKPAVPKTAAEFKELRKINKDIVGWINIPGTEINYPLVQGKDNEYYLKRTFERKQRRCGSIFMDYRNKPDFSDQNTIIYGHNMKDILMFHDLKYFKKQDFYNKHQLIYINLPKKSMVFKIFSVYVTDINFIYNTPEIKDSKEYKDFLKAIKSRSIVKNAVTPGVNDKIITLSTCSYEFDNARLVVHALIDK